MSSDESRKAIYKRSRATTGINKRQWARLFSLGQEKGATEVDKKEKAIGEANSRGVNMPEALASGLLEYFYRQGYDVEKMEFDGDGNIVNIPTK